MSSAPLFDAWRADADRRLSARGRTAELARHLTARYGRQSRSWQRHIAAILSGELELPAKVWEGLRASETIATGRDWGVASSGVAPSLQTADGLLVARALLSAAPQSRAAAMGISTDS